MGLHVVEHGGHSQLDLLSLGFTFVFRKSGKLTWKDSQCKQLEVSQLPSLFLGGDQFSQGYVIKMAWPREERTNPPKAAQN